LGTLILIGGSLVLLAFVCWLTYQSDQLLQRWEPEFNLLLAPAENLARLGLIALCLLIGLASGVSAVRLGWASRALWLDVVLGLGTGLVVQVTVNWLTFRAIGAFGKDVYSPKVMKAILPRSPREQILVPLALLPAVLLEELLFRSLLLGGFSLFAPPLLLAAVFSLLFGLMHAPQGRFGIVVTAIVGFLLSLLFLWRWSLLPTVVAHYAINLRQLRTAERQRDWLERYGN
jgi:membrane protease YdiL (CAAX protease family)